MRTARNRRRSRSLTRWVASFTAHFIPEAVGGYSVIVPALPGCNTQGETLAEAEANARDAIRVYLESLVAHGEPVPRETVAKQITVSVARRRV